MSQRRCKNCLSTDLHASRPLWWDTRGMSLVVRPVRCQHCQTRQYVPANATIDALSTAFHRIDEGINRLHPQALLNLLDRTGRPSPTNPKR